MCVPVYRIEASVPEGGCQQNDTQSLVKGDYSVIKNKNIGLTAPFPIDSKAFFFLYAEPKLLEDATHLPNHKMVWLLIFVSMRL